MGKAKDGSECYTRTGKGGGKYVTCEGTQKGGAKKKSESARKDLRKKVPEKKKVTKAQFENARKKLAGGTASGKSKKSAPKKKLGTKIEKPKEVKKEKPKPATPKPSEVKKPSVMIVVKLKNYGRGVNKSELSGWKKLSYAEVFGSKAKKSPANIGNEYYLKNINSEKGRKEIEMLSRGYPKEISFFKISRIDKKFGLMGESSISHTEARRGDF
jgi:hypothetical protein